MAWALDNAVLMKHARQITGILLLAATGCTPIAPSVHKSVLRSGEPQRVVPASSPSPQAVQRVRADVEGTPIEVRWIPDDELLSQELESSGSDLQLRVSSEQIQSLRREGTIRITLPEDHPGKTLRKLRLLMRVQMTQERLEKQLSNDTWDFAWETADKSSILVTETASVSGKSTSVIQDALVSIHLVLVDRAAQE